MKTFEQIQQIEKLAIANKKAKASEVRSAIAKLMATERITVEHSNVFTASFNVRDRILSLPVWKEEISNDLYRLMITHEVGHALYTPYEESQWKELKENPNLFAVTNIIEDARIEKKILKKFPGCRKSFPIGYKELFSMKKEGSAYDFNNPGNLKDRILVDRINLHYKIGLYNSIDIPFEQEELHWLNEIDACETFEDVINLAKKLCEQWEKEQEQEQEQQDEGQNQQKSKGEGKSQLGESDLDIMTEEEFDNLQKNSGEQTENGETVEVEFQNPEKQKEMQEKASQNNNQNQTKPTKKILVVESQKDLDNLISQLVDKDHRSVPLYVNFPRELKEKEFVIDYKTVHAQIENYYRGHNKNQLLTIASEHFDKFRQATKKVINNMANIFEMKKRARLHSRAKISKTGILNFSKVHSYRYNEDIFKKITTIPEGKSHGLLMFIDMSGSMTNNMRGTYEQTLNLVLFCKKVGIPFEVYGFVDTHRNPGMQDSLWTSGKVGEWVFSGSNKLRQYFTNKMSMDEFKRASANIMSIISAYGNVYDFEKKYGIRPVIPTEERLGSTPLNFCVYTSSIICNRFKEQYNLDIVNCIYLTDGQATDAAIDIAANRDDTRYYHTNKTNNGLYVHTNKNHYTKNVIFRDSKTKKEWKIEPDESDIHRGGMKCRGHEAYITETLLKMVRETCGVNAICYFVSGSNAGKYFIERLGSQYNIDPSQKIKQYNKEGCFFWNEVDGYSNYYLIKDGDDLYIDEEEFDYSEANDVKEVQKQYRKSMEQLVVSRTFLNKFIENIS